MGAKTWSQGITISTSLLVVDKSALWFIRPSQLRYLEVETTYLFEAIVYGPHGLNQAG